MKWLRNLLNGSRKATAPANVVTVQKKVGNVYEIRVGGTLNKAAIERLQTIAVQEIERGAKDLKLLLILSGFEGWKTGDDWGDVGFFARYGNDMAKIAAVGEARWQEQTLDFLLVGRRRGEVRYFTPEQESQARAWLAG